jgi:hypothetical protein
MQAALAALVAGAAALFVASPAWAAHEGHAAQDDAGKGGGKGGGGHEGHGGGGGHGMHAPGSVQPMCHGTQGDMPPHYCDPSYKVASSVPGVQVADVKVKGECCLTLTLRSTRSDANPRIVIVGGAGRLAGASVVNAGWRDGTTVSLAFDGEDSVYDHAHVHLHVFPVTAK